MKYAFTKSEIGIDKSKVLPTKRRELFIPLTQINPAEITIEIAHLRKRRD